VAERSLRVPPKLPNPVRAPDRKTTSDVLEELTRENPARKVLVWEALELEI
jgi:hypothetical protein